MYYVNYSEGAQEEWCADFVSWIFNKAGDPFTGGRDGWDLAGVEQIEDQGTSNSNFTWHPYTSNYIPVPGDIAIFSWGGQANPNWAQSHTAIVTAVDTGSKTVTYLGGDQSNPLEEINGDDETEYGGPDSNSLLSYMPSSSGGYYYNNLVEGYVSPN
jgi:hypothetical protein